MKTLLRLGLLAGLGLVTATGCQQALERRGTADLIPRSTLFGAPDRAGVQISPDGSQISYLAPVDGVLNVWVAPRNDLAAARAITQDSQRGIRNYRWAMTSQHLLYVQDTGGDENWRLHSVEIASGKDLDLTPFENTQARIQEVSRHFPTEILVAVNDRSPQLHDLYRINVTNGERTKIYENPQFVGVITDEQYKVRFGFLLTPDGGAALMAINEAGEATPAIQIPTEDTMTTNPVGLSADGQTLYMTDSRGRDTSALVAWNVADGSTKVLAKNEKADVDDVLFDPMTRKPQAVSFDYLRSEWDFLQGAVLADFAELKTLGDGEISIASRTLADDTWIVALTEADAPVKYYVWDREKEEAQFLFTNRTALEGVSLASLQPRVIESRDGLGLVSYLSLPVGTDDDGDGVPDEALPMVLVVHGGPWARDSYGYNNIHQLLANRGYAVLSVNFRGSTGFGKAFLNASNLEWGRKMHDDLLDAVDWAVEEGVAQKDQVAIMGGSYGGYATLVGMTMTPEVFACGVDIVGPSNIVTLLNTIPPYWAPMVAIWKTRVGDWTTEEGKAMLEERSPLTHVGNIVRPLLIGQGANDPRVKQAESDQIVAAMETKGIPVTYALFPDEGHGFARPDNNLAFFGLTEAFLAQHLGGRYDPLTRKELEASSVEVRAGVAGIPGLTELVSGTR